MSDNIPARKPCLVDETCSDCEGEGMVPCDCCSGTGSLTQNIRHAFVSTTHLQKDELLALQKDACRVEAQYERLITLKPERTSSYTAQLNAVLKTIATQYRNANKCS